uniref:EF-hand domain-containing protein n=1 Tax=Plectus sambesii TaxID=2011161 RepID=A0A914V4U2_9BILA
MLANLPSLQSSSDDLSSLRSFRFPTKTNPLPSIKSDDMIVRRTNSNNNDHQLLNKLKSIFPSVQTIGMDKLRQLRRECQENDPHCNGWVSAGCMQSILTKYMKRVPHDEIPWQGLIKTFARNPTRPREVFYDKMLRLFAKLHHNDDGEPSIDELLSSQMLVSVAIVRPKPDKLVMDSRLHAKLIADIEKCFKQSGKSLNIERLRPLAKFDFRNGLIDQEEFLDILVAQNIDDVLEPLLPKILSVYADNEGRIDLPGFISCLERSQPLPIYGTKSPMTMAREKEPLAAIGKQRSQEEIDQQMMALTTRQSLVSAINGASSSGRGYKEAVNELCAELSRRTALDGRVSFDEAQALLQRYNDIKEMGLNKRTIESLLLLASDSGELFISIELLRKYLNSM